MSSIQPTVGRICHYHSEPMSRGTGEPCAAVVVAVNEDGSVNLAVWDRVGNPRQVLGTIIHDPDSDFTQEEGEFATWMPYQMKKAAEGNPGSESAVPTTEEGPVEVESAVNLRVEEDATD